jgi:regulation of enolase protein 1 (concanavalin A-like superfamily)
VIDDVTADKAVYLVNFGTKAVSDEFKNAPSSVWTVLGENKDGWKVQSGALAITTAAGDVTLANNNAANVFLQSANTDWTVDTKLTCSETPGMPAQNAGIIAYQDDDNFVKLVYSAQMFRRGGQGGASVQLSSEENGFAKTTVNTTPEGIGNNVVWLRLQKKGDVYTAFYSADGKKFVEAGKLETGLKDIKAGVIACDGVMPSFGGFRRGAMPMADPKPMTASFDYFRIISK